MIRSSYGVIALVLMLLAACGDSSKEPAKPVLPEKFWLAAAPVGAKPVLAINTESKDGDEVVVNGRAGGEVEDFKPNRALFTLVDLSLKDCYDMQDECKTPWDYCCVDATTLAKGSAVIEFKDEGRILATTARGFHGLDHLKSITVVGTFKKDAQGNVTITAKGVHVAP